MLPLAITTGHEIGLAVVGACFIAFALGSSFLFPRVRPQFPGRGLPAFIVVAFVFFFGMLTAVAVFGAEKKEIRPGTTTTGAGTTATTTQSKPQVVRATETEFKITLATTALRAGSVTFQVRNAGRIPHDLAVAGGPKTSLIQPGGTATLTTTLKAGPLELYCTVPGHKQAGMDLKLTVS